MHTGNFQLAAGDDVMDAPAASRLSGRIVFRGSIYDGSGYADEARGIVFGLYRAGISVHLEPLGLQQDAHNLLTRDERELLEALRHQNVDSAGGVYVQHNPACDFNPSMRSRHLVGRTMYETDSIPDGWRRCCESMDEIWVPSKFNLKTFASAGVSSERLHVLPGGINTTAFQPGGRTPFPIPNRRGSQCRFRSLRWTDRKARRRFSCVLMCANSNRTKMSVLS